MALYTKDDIVEHAKALAKMIAETEEVEFFKQAEAQINENKKVKNTIEKIKFMQKQAVNFQHYGKKEAQISADKEIDEMHAQLDSIPVVQQFKSSQVEVNELLQLVTSTITNTLTNEIISSTGGDLLTGETGSKIRNSLKL